MGIAGVYFSVLIIRRLSTQQRGVR